jgi:hypothetical protein
MKHQDASTPNFLTKSITDLIPYVNNSRTHTDVQINQVAASIKEFGFLVPVLIDANDMIVAGHCRVQAAQRLKMTDVPCMRVSHLTETQVKAYVIADNKLALNAGWDDELLKLELEFLKDDEFDLSLLGFSETEIDSLLSDEDLSGLVEDEPKGSLADRFMAPPFSVLDARQGYWQARKRYWLSLGIDSVQGRDAECFHNSINGEKYDRFDGLSATSIFDPMLCELAYRWFSPVNGVVLDPFAGDSVRGIIAAKTGRQYVGIDLRAEQVETNVAQWLLVKTKPNPIKNGENPGLTAVIDPVWHTGDSRMIEKLAVGVEADFVFSCPPYADLEVYSDDPNDLSTLAYDEFITAYKEIIKNTCGLLKQDRFACFVVDDIRDKKGMYRNFVSDTINAFIEAGLNLYNEAILVTPVGTMAVRASKAFTSGRKLVKGHQNVLVFVKGDPKKATIACGDVEDFVLEEEEAAGD